MSKAERYDYLVLCILFGEIKQWGQFQKLEDAERFAEDNKGIVLTVPNYTPRRAV
jgi:hypothetical protein